MRRRYGLTAVFNDPDFDMGYGVKRYWSKSSVMNALWNNEQERLWNKGFDWHWVVIDLKTGKDITPIV